MGFHALVFIIFVYFHPIVVGHFMAACILASYRLHFCRNLNNAQSKKKEMTYATGNKNRNQRKISCSRGTLKHLYMELLRRPAADTSQAAVCSLVPSAKNNAKNERSDVWGKSDIDEAEFVPMMSVWEVRHSCQYSSSAPRCERLGHARQASPRNRRGYEADSFKSCDSLSNLDVIDETILI